MQDSQKTKQTFKHRALNLQNKQLVVYTALSKKYFYMRMLIVKFVLEKGHLPLNPFMSFEYYLLDTVDRDVIRAANNNLVALAEELWVFGSISNGVIAEIKQATQQKKLVRYFEIKKDKQFIEKSIREMTFEDGMEQFRDELI